jgi:hypothetical protein
MLMNRIRAVKHLSVRKGGPITQPIGWVGFDVIPSHRFWWVIGCDEYTVKYEPMGF